ncbi:tetratricopeptide repeat protein [Desulfopila aestuarii]|uniref:Predicted methyltransferase, contains TPR repeat n=1 Tax=Desulfopila aestuarii DSM 18488 TaxID=1121416 RepID=A0A1M7YCR3_9BACT|nr:tetratricopeptide repeat protein [Desulfopila aestuarii]SHO50442.1 Predicted methyltransferase, contains TPR repeat [Desulfopila aestuarii DSM 18488]
MWRLEKIINPDSRFSYLSGADPTPRIRSTMHDLNTIFAEAVRCHQQGLFSEAQSRYLTVLEALPDNINILGNLGLLCRDMGNLEEALHYCLRAAKAAPDDPVQQVNLGAVYEAMGRLDQARSCYEKALAQCPNHPKALNNLGKLLHLQGEAEKAQTLIEQAVAIDPGSSLALNNLGVILSARGNTRSAITYIEKSLQLDPANIETLYNLAGLYNCEGQYDSAAELLERLLALAPSHGPASHMLAALRGEVPPTAPPDYVAMTFDRYAGRFDRHIQEVLGYTAPLALAEMTYELTDQPTFDHCLDLGCGTGLSGAAFQPLAGQLTGVDISPLMLSQAQAKNIYARLECAEILSFLDTEKQQYDLVVAADVFIYLGQLEPVFQRLQRLAVPGALLACSIERTQQNTPFTLRVSGRYAHNPDYLVQEAHKAGFGVKSHREHDLRKENNNWIAGDLFIFEKESHHA